MAGFFKCPNKLIDELAQYLTPVEFMVMVIVIRKTRGWHKSSDPIALSQFMKLTGIKSNNTILRAVAVLSDSSIGLLESSKKRGCSTVYKPGKVFDELARTRADIAQVGLSNIAQVRVQILHRLGGKTCADIAHTKDNINKSKEVKEKSRGKTLKENALTGEVNALAGEYINDENGLAPEVKALAYARDNQGLCDAGKLAGIEPLESELEHDFRVRLLGSITGGLANALQG